MLETAMAGAHRTIGERDGPLQRVENARGADVVGRTRQLITTTRAARGSDEAGALELFEELAHGGGRDAGAVGEGRRVERARAIAGESRQDHRRVVRQLADSQHFWCL